MPWRMFLITLLWLPSLSAAPSRAELLFDLSTALKQQDKEAVIACFSFNGASEESKQSFLRIVDRICAWPNHYVKTTERSGSGGSTMEVGGRRLELNGDWTFQVHIYADPESKKGFVFPAGTSGNGTYILVAKDG